MSTSNTSENNIINKISKDLLNKLDPSIATDIIKRLPKQLYLTLKKNNLLKKDKKNTKNMILKEEILSEDDYKSDSLETNPDYISSTNLPYNIPVPIPVHENNLYQDNMQPKYRPGSYRPPQIISTGIEGFDEEDNTKQNVPVPESSTQQSDTQSSFEKQAPEKPVPQQPAPPQPISPQPISPQPISPQPIFQQPVMPFTSLPLNIFSLDLRQLLSFSLKATGDTFSDIYKLYSTNSPITFMSIISILLTDNRILYLGISFLLIAIVMYIFNNFIRLPSLFGVGGSDKKVYINNY